MSNEVRKPTAVAVVRSELEAMGPQFSAALPAHIPVERFMRVVMTAIQNNPKLVECTRSSLFNSAMRAAQDGLLPDGREGAIVEYAKEASWMVMIGGIRKKARNSGEIATWDVQAVYEKDQFDFELGDDPFIRHKPTLGDKGKLIAVYSVATLKSGEKSRDVMSVSDVEKIRSKSKSQKGPWSDPIFYPEMAKKTVARRHSKVLPMSSDLDDLIRRDDALYDISGASDVRVKVERPATISGRLDRLVGSSVSQQSPAQVSTSSKSQNAGGAGGNAKAAIPDAGSDDAAEGVVDPAAVKEEGAKARADGLSRKAVPPAYRDDETLLASWLDGFDGEATNGEKP